MQLNDLALAIGVVVIAVLAIPLLVGGVLVVLVVANRADPDPSGRRPATVYALATSFVTLFVTLFATTGIVSSLCNLIGSHDRGDGGGSGPDALFAGGGGGAAHPVGDAVARGAVISLLIALVAGVAYLLHTRGAARLSAGAPPADPVARVRSSYVSAVCFVCVLLVVGTTVVVLYDVFRLAGPGVFAPGESDRLVVLRGMIPLAYLGLAAFALLLMHLRHVPPGMRPRLADRLPAGPLDSAFAPQPGAMVGEPSDPSPGAAGAGPLEPPPEESFSAPEELSNEPASPRTRASAPRKRTPRPPSS